MYMYIHMVGENVLYANIIGGTAEPAQMRLACATLRRMRFACYVVSFSSLLLLVAVWPWRRGANDSRIFDPRIILYQYHTSSSHTPCIGQVCMYVCS